MRSGLIFVCLIAVFLSGSLGCSKPAEPPGISNLVIGKNAKAEPPANSFNVDELIYAIARPANTNGSYNLNFEVTTDSPINQRGKGEPVMNKSVDFVGVQAQFLNFSIAYPGQYKIEAILSDASGNVIDSKSGIITVTGEPVPLEREHDRDKDEDRDQDKAPGKDRKGEKAKERDRK